MAKKRDLQVFSISFLDLLSGALGAVIILYISVPKSKIKLEETTPTVSVKEYKKKEFELNAFKERSSKIMRDLIKLEQKHKDLKVQNKLLQDKLISTQQQTRELASSAQNPLDVGFNFKGKNIVFAIDVSGSMFNEDRIGQVKAGLKMLVTSMPAHFNIDVIYFPYNSQGNYLPLWSSLKSLDKSAKFDIFSFLQNLRPYGSTPTRWVLEYALTNYPKASDIVLLSDGAPTLNGSTKRDNIWSILEFIKKRNTKKIQINTIGVGGQFLRKNANEAYIFLRDLAAQNNGFFVGF